MGRATAVTNTFDPLLTAIYYRNGNTQYFQIKDTNQHLLSSSFSWFQNTNPWTYNPSVFAYFKKGEPAWYKQLDISRVSIDSVIIFYKHPQRTQLMKYTASTKTWEDETPITINDGNELLPSNLDNALLSYPYVFEPVSGSTNATHQFGVVSWTGGQEGDYFFFNGPDCINAGLNPNSHSTQIVTTGAPAAGGGTGTREHDCSEFMWSMRDVNGKRLYANEVAIYNMVYGNSTFTSSESGDNDFSSESIPVDGFTQETKPADGFFT